MKIKSLPRATYLGRDRKIDRGRRKHLSLKQRKNTRSGWHAKLEAESHVVGKDDEEDMKVDLPRNLASDSIRIE